MITGSIKINEEPDVVETSYADWNDFDYYRAPKKMDDETIKLNIEFDIAQAKSRGFKEGVKVKRKKSYSTGYYNLGELVAFNTTKDTAYKPWNGDIEVLQVQFPYYATSFTIDDLEIVE